MKKGLFQEAINNIITPKSAPTESLEAIMAGKHKMPIAGPECDGCGDCSEACPSGAINMEGGWTVDIGRCIFCRECHRICSKGAMSLTDAPDFVLTRNDLVFTKDSPPVKKEDRIEREKLDVFGRSIFIREIDTGSCNGCEVEVTSLSNQFYDVERFGIKIVPSPRHADVLLITGPLTKNMSEALKKAVAATPNPKVVIAMGTCAISGGMFSKGEVVGEGIGEIVKVDMYIPGCPPPPDKLIRAILTAFGLFNERR
ncbi:MAG: NADH-quinone oxidoreductase subunit NuoB [Candidatus Methanoplasma sp.]|nr:NADH-quinone oxidoreductase subunit NuoB [Candidatus Methanoplasma sp.]